MVLPGYEGSPVRGLKDHKVNEAYLRKCKLVHDIHFRIFNMTNDEDVAKYEKLMTAAGSNEFVKVWKEEWLTSPADAATGSPLKIAVKWSERFLQQPDSGRFLSDGNPLGD